MSIKPENKRLYPKNWKQINEYIRFEHRKQTRKQSKLKGQLKLEL